MMYRYALYYMPSAGTPLSKFGAAVLGRNADTGVSERPPPVLSSAFGDWPTMTEAPRRYGFHATLKAPFHLADGVSETQLLDDVAAFAERTAPVELPRLCVTRLGRFLALTPTQANTDLTAFAANVVRDFDALRAPMTTADRARRMQSNLSPRQIELLDAWGYPHVLDQFRFHMTLTGPLAEADATAAHIILTDLFSDVAQPD
ncbi:MAG: DUF1045 domain-containing protein, partial [Pseudomonadota bacterium]